MGHLLLVVGKMKAFGIIILTVVLVAGLPRPIYEESAKRIEPLEEIKVIRTNEKKISAEGLNDIKLERNVSLCKNVGEKRRYGGFPDTRRIDANEAWMVAEEDEEEERGRRGQRRQEEETKRNWQDEETNIVDDARKGADELMDVRFFGMPVAIAENLAKVDAKNTVNVPRDWETLKNVESRFDRMKLIGNEDRSRSLQEDARSEGIEEPRRKDGETMKTDFKVNREGSRGKVNSTSSNENKTRSEKIEEETAERRNRTEMMKRTTKSEETRESKVTGSGTRSSKDDERGTSDNSAKMTEGNLPKNDTKSEVKKEKEVPVVEVAGRIFDDTLEKPEESEDDEIERNEVRGATSKNSEKEHEEVHQSEEDHKDKSSTEELQKMNYNVEESSKSNNEGKASSRKTAIENQEWRKKKKMRTGWKHLYTPRRRAIETKMRSTISLISSSKRDDECSFEIRRAYGGNRTKPKRQLRGKASKECTKSWGQRELRANPEETAEGKLSEASEDRFVDGILFSIASRIEIGIQPIIEPYEEPDDELNVPSITETAR